MAKTYKIIRFFEEGRGRRMVIKTGLSLEEAQEHCRDKETNSITASGLVETTLTRNFGRWFDGYEEETVGHDKKG